MKPRRFLFADPRTLAQYPLLRGFYAKQSDHPSFPMPREVGACDLARGTGAHKSRLRRGHGRTR